MKYRIHFNGRDGALVGGIDGLSRFLLISLAFVCPIFFIPGTEDPFRPAKELLVNWAGLSLLFLQAARWLSVAPRLFPNRSDQNFLPLLRGNPLPLLMALLLSWLVFSTLTSPLPWVSLGTLLNDFALAGVFLATCRVADYRLAKAAGLALVLSSLFNGLWAFLQYVGRDPIFRTAEGNPIIGHRENIAAFAGNPNYLAPLFVISVTLAVGWLLLSPRCSGRVTWALISVFFILALIITQTFAALASLLVVGAAVILGLWRKKELRRWIVAVATTGIVALFCSWIIFMQFFSGGLDSRIAHRSQAFSNLRPDYLLNGRYYAWQITWEMISDRPFRGHGMGLFTALDFRYESAFPQLDYFEFIKQSGMFNEAHNDYLQFWAENGLIGLVLLLIPIGHIIARALRFLLSPGRGTGPEDPHSGIPGTDPDSRQERLMLVVWALVGLACGVNALGNFPMHLPHLALSLVLAAGICARLSGAWVTSSEIQVVPGRARRAARAALAALVAGMLILCSWWLFRPYQAARLRKQFKPDLQRVSSLRSALQWEKATTMNLALQLIKPAQTLVRADPWTAEGHIYLALAYFYAHQFGDAAKAYGQALILRADATVYANMGATYAEMGEPIEAKRHYGLALLQDPFQFQAQESLRMIGKAMSGKEYPPPMAVRLIPVTIKRP